jgi:hypothetical protein
MKWGYQMKPETAGKVKFGVWGLICGAVIAIIIGFAWGGWTTFRTTQKMSEEAVLASQAAICVSQFIEKGGWDKMPGQEKAGYLVARACSDGLELLFEK